MPSAQRRSAGFYAYRDRLIVRTQWDGPKGGKVWLWEHASWDRGEVVIDGMTGYPTLRAAKAALDTPDPAHA